MQLLFFRQNRLAGPIGIDMPPEQDRVKPQEEHINHQYRSARANPIQNQRPTQNDRESNRQVANIGNIGRNHRRENAEHHSQPEPIPLIPPQKDQGRQRVDEEYAVQERAAVIMPGADVKKSQQEFGQVKEIIGVIRAPVILNLEGLHWVAGGHIHREEVDEETLDRNADQE